MAVYRLYANVVHDLSTEWALTEGPIPNTQFGFCPTRNANQTLFILRRAHSTARNRKENYLQSFWTSKLPKTMFRGYKCGNTCRE
eukprot:238255-Pelagomonas_calceolata.AAC.1